MSSAACSLYEQRGVLETGKILNYYYFISWGLTEVLPSSFRRRLLLGSLDVIFNGHRYSRFWKYLYILCFFTILRIFLLKQDTFYVIFNITIFHCETY